MKTIILAATLLLAGCAGGIGGDAYQGAFNSPFVDIRAVPTVAPEGMEPMGYRAGDEQDIYTTFSDGTVRATGRAAWAMALARLCAVAPNSELCGAPVGFE